MGSEWKSYHLGDIATFAYGKMPKSNVLTDGLYPTFSGYKYQYNYPEYNCDKWDVIVVARGVGGTGDVKIVKERCYLTNLSIKITLDPTVVNNGYFYYNYFNSNLRYLDSGSAQSQITINDLNRVPLSLPPLTEQKAIAHILGSLDDKIELNRRMNATLEGMAQALFKSWFVDFDPVIDNALVAGNPIPEELAERAELRRQALSDGTANREVAKQFQQHGHGSVFNTITRGTFKSIYVPFGRSELTQDFDKTVNPFLERICSNLFQNVELTKLRDTLLPKLISGELRIPEVEKLAEEAVV